MGVSNITLPLRDPNAKTKLNSKMLIRAGERRSHLHPWNCPTQRKKSQPWKDGKGGHSDSQSEKKQVKHPQLCGSLLRALVKAGGEGVAGERGGSAGKVTRHKGLWF